MQNVTEERWKYIGGSDIGAIMGISPFKTRWQLLQEKAQIIEPDFQGNEYTEYGNRMEEKIRAYVNSLYNRNFIEDKVIDGDMRYHADGHDLEHNEVLEIKTTSQIHDDVMGYKFYLVQLLTGMKLNGSSHGFLAVYERPDDFNEEFDDNRLTVYTVKIESFTDLLEEIEYQVDRFREDLKKLRENPFLTEEELQPFELVALSDSVIALENKLPAYKEIEQQYKSEKEQLKQAMQKYGIKKWTTNNGVKITLVEDGKDTIVTAFDEKKFKSENPELYDKYTTAKVKKARAGYVRITL